MRTLRTICIVSCALLLVCGAAFVSRATASEDGSAAVPALLLIGTPFGVAEAAKMARTLLPKRVSAARLVPLSKVRPEKGGRTMPDGGVDAVDGGGGGGEETASIEEQAREAALAFNLVTAAELWRRAAEALITSDAVVFRPQTVAHALMEAGAASAAAGERDLARFYFRRAIAVDSDIRPGPEISPGAKEIFEAGRREGPVLLEIPRDAILEAICRRTEMDGLVWVAAGKGGSGWDVSFKLYISGDKASELETRRHAAPLSDEVIADQRLRFEGILARKLLGDGGFEAPVVRIGSAQTRVKKPWYRKWWVYALGGALIAGGAAGVTTWLMLRPEEATVTAHY